MKISQSLFFFFTKNLMFVKIPLKDFYKKLEDFHRDFHYNPSDGLSGKSL